MWSHKGGWFCLMFSIPSMWWQQSFQRRLNQLTDGVSRHKSVGSRARPVRTILGWWQRRGAPRRGVRGKGGKGGREGGKESPRGDAGGARAADGRRAAIHWRGRRGPDITSGHAHRIQHKEIKIFMKRLSHGNTSAESQGSEQPAREVGALLNSRAKHANPFLWS